VSTVQYSRFGTFLAFTWLTITSCRSPQATPTPTIQFSQIPPAGDGSPVRTEAVAGHVTGARKGQRVVLFARSGVWWVQPTVEQPFTEIQSDSTWASRTHPGAAYAALLVDSSYRAPSTTNVLPERGGAVLAVTVAEAESSPSAAKKLSFDGYQWEVMSTANNHGGSTNFYETSNAFVDHSGWLHLRIARHGQQWTSAQVKLIRSLGYGSYRFIVRDVSQLEPAAVLSFYTWDDIGPPREMDIEVGRWGEIAGKNAQFVVQPYVVPANSVRFIAPPGKLTYSLQWQPGSAAFKTLREAASFSQAARVVQHVFTSGIPSAGNENVHISLFVFDNRHNPLQRETEVIVEKFEFLP
jgi:hypothetical protein